MIIILLSAITDSGLEFNAKSIIIATGAQARWLNIESENKFKGFGVSACATCDGFFFKDQNIIVSVEIGAAKISLIVPLNFGKNIPNEVLLID